MKAPSSGSLWGNGASVFLLVIAVRVALAWHHAPWNAPSEAEMQMRKWQAESERMQQFSADLDREMSKFPTLDRVALDALLKPSPSPGVIPAADKATTAKPREAGNPS